MIKIEKTEVLGWEHAIRGMRNSHNSWHMSDSEWVDGDYFVGEKDLRLMKRLSNAGTDHSKFMRMIAVYADITAPLYLWGELDTYKVGTVRNSCSFMHKGMENPYCIDDFSVKDERMYEVLSPLKTKEHRLYYPYETNEFKRYTALNGRKYRVYRNGKVIREAFDYVDCYGSGRTRHFEEQEATIYQNKSGYFLVKLSGRDGGHILLHRLVAQCWLDEPSKDDLQVNHIDGNKGNNSVENLEWVTPSENVKKAREAGLYENTKGLHRLYQQWKSQCSLITPSNRTRFMNDCINGMRNSELSEKYNITPNQVNTGKYNIFNSTNEELFQECYLWERLIDTLNSLRELYLESKDELIFQQIRCLLPQGYLQKSTLMLNYQVLKNMYHARKNHKLDEWREFCNWIETLPHAKELICEV